MNERGGFPWPLAVAGAGLMLVSMLTVSIRASVVAEGAELRQMVLRRASVERQLGSLELRFQALCRELGTETRRPSWDRQVGP